MKHLGLAVALCGAMGLAAAGEARAFEIQGGGDNIPTAAPFAEFNQGYVNQEFTGHSLAMPYSSKVDDLGHVSSYGNAIPIPGPGISMPAPAWAYSPAFR